MAITTTPVTSTLFMVSVTMLTTRLSAASELPAAPCVPDRLVDVAMDMPLLVGPVVRVSAWWAFLVLLGAACMQTVSTCLTALVRLGHWLSVYRLLTTMVVPRPLVRGAGPRTLTMLHYVPLTRTWLLGLPMLSWQVVLELSMVMGRRLPPVLTLRFRVRSVLMVLSVLGCTTVRVSVPLPAPGYSLPPKTRIPLGVALKILICLIRGRWVTAAGVQLGSGIPRRVALMLGVIIDRPVLSVLSRVRSVVRPDVVTLDNVIHVVMLSVTFSDVSIAWDVCLVVLI